MSFLDSVIAVVTLISQAQERRRQPNRPTFSSRCLPMCLLANVDWSTLPVSIQLFQRANTSKAASTGSRYLDIFLRGVERWAGASAICTM